MLEYSWPEAFFFLFTLRSEDMIGDVCYSAVKVRFDGAAADMLVCCFF